MPAKYFISYPKSGRTWLCFMYHYYLARLLNLKYTTLYDVYQQMKQGAWGSEWTHFGTEPRESRGFYHQADLTPLLCAPTVFLTRGIEDTLVSYYYHMKHRECPPYEGTISDMLRDPKHGIAKICCFYRMMKDNESNFKSLFKISYEDLQESCLCAFGEMLHWIGFNVYTELLQETVEQHSFKKMQKLSRQPEYMGSPLAPTSDNPDSAKIRQGKVGGYGDVLSFADLEYINRAKDILLG